MEQSKFYQIKNVTEHDYTLVGCDGSVITRPIRDIDKTATVFTIEDAKDGDVLVDCFGNICIYQKLSTNTYYHTHCYGNHKYFIDDGGSHQVAGTYPATKEQRDLLFQKMNEGGYEWDAEKKELKKIEQKPVEWSEEDERMFDAVIADIQFTQKAHNHEVNQVVYEREIDWLKALKDIVQPKPRQEWSEEDELMIQDAIHWINEFQKSNRCKDENDMQNSVTCENWLKALRPKHITYELDAPLGYDKDMNLIYPPINHWKPSEEQMRAVFDASERNDKMGSVLRNLYDDLRKL